MAQPIANSKREKNFRKRKQNYFEKALEMDESSQKQIKTARGETFCKLVLLFSTRDD